MEDWRAVGEVRSSESLRPRFATSAHDHASLPSWQDLGHSCLAAFAWTIGSDFANQVGDDEIGNDERDRQGSVESPAFFALIADVCVEEAGRRFGWHAECPGLEGLNLREVLFMDDAIVWDTSGPVLGRRLEQLAVVLAEWGLRLNVDKCQLYRSPYCNSQDDVVVGGHTLVADDHLAVMGLKFRVNQTASEMLAPLLGRARDVFWSLKHILCRGTNLHKRIHVLDTCVGNSLLWCSGALQPDVQALGMINSFQLQLIVWMLRRRRRGDEKWLDFHTRVFREARAVLHGSAVDRWSSRWLAAIWRFSGHRARCADRPVPGAGAVVDAFRDLQWWERQQQSPTGLRHRRRFFAKLMTHEHHMDRAAGGPWRSIAADRSMWKSREALFVKHLDVSWTSARQPALPY